MWFYTVEQEQTERTETKEMSSPVRIALPALVLLAVSTPRARRGGHFAVTGVSRA
jgi:hypothetical protein